jgi:N-acetylglucosamine-6-phosphate deacetylase
MAAFDLQVNGYAGVDFNGDLLQEDELGRVCKALEEDGVPMILGSCVPAWSAWFNCGMRIRNGVS